MRKLICFIILPLVTALMIMVQSPEQTKEKKTLKSLSYNSEKENTFPDKVEPIKEEISVNSINQMEKDYNSLTENELRNEITKNQELENRDQLILKANQGSLSGTESKHLLKYVRTNTVLHQLLLERQLQDLEERI